MLRYLTERLPVMITPRWVDTRIQPIAVKDVLRYLVGSAAMPPEVNRGFDIGGPDVLTYRQMMAAYARISGLKPRRVAALPLFTPSLSSHWVGLVTPVPNSIARPLVESLINEVICKEHDIAAYVPDPDGGLLGFQPAVELALQRIQDHRVTTSWSSAATTGAPSDPFELSVGDALDWWRVEEIEDNHRLRLRAEMLLPGLAWLELIIDTDAQGQTLFRQRALFHPRGLAGHLYWAVIRPFHGVVFGGMQRNIARAAASLPPGDVTSSVT